MKRKKEFREVDLFVDNTPLTKEEEEMISRSIEKRKAELKRKNRRVRLHNKKSGKATA